MGSHDVLKNSEAKTDDGEAKPFRTRSVGPPGGLGQARGLDIERFGLAHLHVNSNVYPSLVPRDGRAGNDEVGTRAGRVPDVPAYVVVAAGARWAIALLPSSLSLAINSRIFTQRP